MEVKRQNLAVECRRDSHLVCVVRSESYNFYECTTPWFGHRCCMLFWCDPCGFLNANCERAQNNGGHRILTVVLHNPISYASTKAVLVPPPHTLSANGHCKVALAAFRTCSPETLLIPGPVPGPCSAFPCACAYWNTMLVWDLHTDWCCVVGSLQTPLSKVFCQTPLSTQQFKHNKSGQHLLLLLQLLG